jgi:hypothetical protein
MLYSIVSNNKVIYNCQNIYFVTKIGQSEYVTISEAVLPNNNFLNPDFPFVPMTIKLILFCSAYCSISP